MVSQELTVFLLDFEKKFISMYQSGNKVDDDDEANPNDDSEGDEDTNEAAEHQEAAANADAKKEQQVETEEANEGFRHRETDVIESLIKNEMKSFENEEIEKEEKSEA